MSSSHRAHRVITAEMPDYDSSSLHPNCTDGRHRSDDGAHGFAPRNAGGAGYLERVWKAGQGRNVCR